MTEATHRALQGLRDPSTLQWYVIPLLAALFYIYAVEVRRARETGEWGAVIAGVTLFGMDFLNETLNGWVLNLTQRSALWTAPGPTALRTMVGWNVEIMFMFALSGIVFHHTLPRQRDARILGVPAPWFIGAAFSAICVAVELVLNRGGLLVWEYSFWSATPAGTPLIFLFGYLHFYAAVIFVLGMRTTRARLATIGGIWGLAVALNVIGMGVLGWTY